MLESLSWKEFISQEERAELISIIAFVTLEITKVRKPFAAPVGFTASDPVEPPRLEHKSVQSSLNLFKGTIVTCPGMHNHAKKR